MIPLLFPSPDVSRPPAAGGRGASAGRRAGRLVLGALAIAALGLAIAQAGRLPGPAGDALRANIETGQDATGVFYTDVEGWKDLSAP